MGIVIRYRVIAEQRSENRDGKSMANILLLVSSVDQTELAWVWHRADVGCTSTADIVVQKERIAKLKMGLQALGLGFPLIRRSPPNSYVILNRTGFAGGSNF
ncbi:hypothetical protein [Rhizobium sp. Rhizsp82]|uniref:hypothetical protein n=1 Tax=Rhizobium sp. Rhizsp82 TaxID=3243057 RepID=UPI0039B4D9C6